MKQALIDHCNSVGKDKNGLTDCRKCPADVRAECFKQVPMTYQALAEKEARMNELLQQSAN